MHYIAATLATLGFLVDQSVEDARATLKDDRGSVTIEQVLWAVAVIAIVGIVVVAIRGFVERKATEISD